MKVPQKSKNQNTIDPAIALLSIHPEKKMKTLIQIDIGIKMFIAALFTIVKKKKGSNPSAHQQIKKIWWASPVAQW